MQTTMWHDNLDKEERPRLGPPIAWAIGAVAVMSVFAVVVIIVNYAPLNRAGEQRVESALPPATYDTIASMIRASGNTCTRVCAVTAGSALGSPNELDVACQSDTATSCSAPHHFRVTIEAKTGPQR